MNRDQKAAVIDEVASQIEEADAIFAVDYRGLSVKQAADLRGRLIEIDANLRVVKNTLTERAAEKAGAEALKQFLEGPTAFTFVKGDPVLAAKALAGFRREAQLPQFKGGWMDGKELSIDDIEALSRLPSLDVMHGQLVGMVAAPLVGLVRSLNALLSGIAVALGQIQEQGLVGQGVPETPGSADGDAEVAPAGGGAEAPAEAAAAGGGAEGPAEAAPADDGAEAPAAPASADAAETPANGGDQGVAAEAAAPVAEPAPPASASADAAETPANSGDEGVAAEAAAPVAEPAPPASASADAAETPANDGDQGAAAEAAAPVAEHAPPADSAEEPAPAPDAAEDPAPAPDSAGSDSSPAAAVGAEGSPSAPADAPDPSAAEEIPNQPMPAPEQAADAANDNETSNEEGDN